MGRWVREGQADKKHAFPGLGQMKPDDAEVARLKRELIRVKAERDILKKPLGSSSHEPAGKLLGQCRHGKLFLDAEDRADESQPVLDSGCCAGRRL